MCDNCRAATQKSATERIDVSVFVREILNNAVESLRVIKGERLSNAEVYDVLLCSASTLMDRSKSAYDSTVLALLLRRCSPLHLTSSQTRKCTTLLYLLMRYMLGSISAAVETDSVRQELELFSSRMRGNGIKVKIKYPSIVFSSSLSDDSNLMMTSSTLCDCIELESAAHEVSTEIVSDRLPYLLQFELLR
jgi:hypothetical protein